ncbi:hypothetical protein AWM75_04400 [Aerococcus urinaehominis]|uniref:Uncharacterized protein n=1 Tax=Aerococcus urinaehominis TaxID=128944 RepID=A0A0X8FL25_9LACT|nr:hypothetical protein [Aerococcus urinaehominis]AMB99287.1 hypothetical protein AWM75_04400 [Aerococcus urinaehominis]SDM19029.1 hypothetical protein SAMN04487985_1088 [Aerococcus urinaehominis]
MSTSPQRMAQMFTFIALFSVVFGYTIDSNSLQFLFNVILPIAMYIASFVVLFKGRVQATDAKISYYGGAFIVAIGLIIQFVILK